MNRSNLDFLRNEGKSDSNHVLTPKIKSRCRPCIFGNDCADEIRLWKFRISKFQSTKPGQGKRELWYKK